MDIKPLREAIPRFRENEGRVDSFVNGDEGATWKTEDGRNLPTVATLIKQQQDLLANGPYSTILTAVSWTALGTLTPSLTGAGAEILDDDTGTHTDPVTGAVVPNAGRYSWSASPAGWRWIGSSGLSSKANASDLDALEGVVESSITQLEYSVAEVAYFSQLGWYVGDLPVGAIAPVVVGTDDRVMVSVDGMNQIEAYRQSLGYFVGDAPEGIQSTPLLVGADNKVIIGDGVADGEDRLTEYIASLGWFSGDLPPNESAPLLVGVDNRVLVGGDQSGGSNSGPLVGRIAIFTDAGQSNAVGATDDAAELVIPYPEPERLFTLARGSARDHWLSLATGGGNSIELDATSVTAIAEMEVVFSNGGHGTTAAETAARARIASNNAPVIIWSNAEGGQTIANLLPSPPTGFHSFENYRKMLTAAQNLKPHSARLVHDWAFMQQGESNTSLADLGDQHEVLRAAYENEARSILGQAEALRMISWQPSSFGSVFAGVTSILSTALADGSGKFICGGPTYCFPWAAPGNEAEAAYLHNSSRAHAMRGEMGYAITQRVSAEGGYQPLHAKSARVTGANEITITLSEAAISEVTDVVAAAANLGVTLVGGNISTIAVTGDLVKIETSGAASSVTAVRFGLIGQSSPRTAARIPRTNIRAHRPLGTYSTGGLIHAWMCHQEISITA